MVSDLFQLAEKLVSANGVSTWIGRGKADFRARSKIIFSVHPEVVSFGPWRRSRLLSVLGVAGLRLWAPTVEESIRWEVPLSGTPVGCGLARNQNLPSLDGLYLTKVTTRLAGFQTNRPLSAIQCDITVIWNAQTGYMKKEPPRRSRRTSRNSASYSVYRFVSFLVNSC
jgi:hypothetical protein